MHINPDETLPKKWNTCKLSLFFLISLHHLFPPWLHHLHFINLINQILVSPTLFKWYINESYYQTTKCGFTSHHLFILYRGNLKASVSTRKRVVDGMNMQRIQATTLTLTTSVPSPVSGSPSRRCTSQLRLAPPSDQDDVCWRCRRRRPRSRCARRGYLKNQRF